MKIYTKTGDKGETGLWGGARVPKNHPRVCAYGEVDELNSCLGAVLSLLPQRKAFSALARHLARIQGELFVVGAILASSKEKPSDMVLDSATVGRLESEIDHMTADLKPLRQFILPGGCPPGALLHVARTVCRRAERAVVSLGTEAPEEIVVYLNRLSDYLFTAARWVNHKLKKGETPWTRP